MDPLTILAELDKLSAFEKAIQTTPSASALLDYIHGARGALLWAAGKPVASPSGYILETIGKIAGEGRG